MKYATQKNNSFGKVGEVLEYFDNKKELIEKLIKNYNLSTINYNETIDMYKILLEDNEITEKDFSFEDFLKEEFKICISKEDLEKFKNKEIQILYAFDNKVGENLGTLIEKENENIDDFNFCLEVFGSETTLYGVRNTYEIKEIPEYKDIILDTTDKNLIKIIFVAEKDNFHYKIEIKLFVEEIKKYACSEIDLENFIKDEIEDSIRIKNFSIEEEDLINYSINDAMEKHLDNIVNDILKSLK